MARTLVMASMALQYFLMKDAFGKEEGQLVKLEGAERTLSFDQRVAKGHVR